MASRSRQRCCTTPRTSHAKTKPSSSHSSGPRRPPSVASTSHSGLRRVSGLVFQKAGRALTHSPGRRVSTARVPSPPARGRRRARSAVERAAAARHVCANFDHVGDGDDAEPRGTRQQPERMTGVERPGRAQRAAAPAAGGVSRARWRASRRQRPASRWRRREIPSTARCRRRTTTQGLQQATSVPG